MSMDGVRKMELNHHLDWLSHCPRSVCSHLHTRPPFPHALTCSIGGSMYCLHDEYIHATSARERQKCGFKTGAELHRC